MKRLLCLLLTAGLALTLWGCASDAPASSVPTDSGTAATEPSTQATEPSTQATEPSTQATEPAQPVPDFARGVVEKGTYRNTFLGLVFAPGDGWQFTQNYQILQYNGLSSSLSEEEILEALQAMPRCQDMEAMSWRSRATVKIDLEKLSENNLSMTVQEFIEAAQENLEAGFTQQGFTDLTSQIATQNFCGTPYPVMKTVGSFMGSTMHKTVVFLRVGDYVGMITVSTWDKDQSEEILAGFSLLTEEPTQ